MEHFHSESRRCLIPCLLFVLSDEPLSLICLPYLYLAYPLPCALR